MVFEAKTISFLLAKLLVFDSLWFMFFPAVFGGIILMVSYLEPLVGVLYRYLDT